MSDIFTKEKRSWIMSRVRNRDTKPELTVRSLLHRLGYRFRLHRKDLPGHPDIVLPKYRKAIFVHGCFWHGHENCSRAGLPATNRQFWEAKVSKNKARDLLAVKQLSELGWRSLPVWQCEVKDSESLTKRLIEFLEG